MPDGAKVADISTIVGSWQLQPKLTNISITPEVTIHCDNMSSHDCLICSDEFVNNDNLTQCSTCNNYIHTHCLYTWTRDNNTCPVCRQNWKTTGKRFRFKN